jgi:transposase-like protein
MGRRSKYSAEFKQDAVSRMGQGGTFRGQTN